MILLIKKNYYILLFYLVSIFVKEKSLLSTLTKNFFVGRKLSFA